MNPPRVKILHGSEVPAKKAFLCLFHIEIYLSMPPKVSKGRPESPLVAPAGAKSYLLVKLTRQFHMEIYLSMPPKVQGVRIALVASADAISPFFSRTGFTHP